MYWANYSQRLLQLIMVIPFLFDVSNFSFIKSMRKRERENKERQNDKEMNLSGIDSVDKFWALKCA